MRTTLCILFLFLPTTTVLSATIHVPNDYPTIQQGIHAAANGDTVLVAPGTYIEQIDFKGKGIHLLGSGGAEYTTIDGRDTWRVVAIGGGVGLDAILEGFTVRNGNDSSCGGILCGSDSSPLIINNVIEDNEYYGIFCAKGSSPTIENNKIVNNKKCGIFAWKSDAPSIRNNIIAGSEESGIFIFETVFSPLIDGNEIEGNDKHGIRLSDVNAIDIINNKIMNNFYSGISSESGSFPLITGNTITGNYSSGISAGPDGSVIIGNNISGNRHGGIHCGGSSPIIIGNVITDNSTNYWGGGILCGNHGLIENNLISRNTSLENGGGLYMNSINIVIRGNIITENHAGGSGGGLGVIHHRPIIENNFIAHNVAAESGGGLLAYSTFAAIHNNRIYGNTANRGGGMALTDSASPTVTNNTFSENTASTEGGGIHCDESEALVTNTILWANDAPSVPEIWIGSTTTQPSIFTISYSDVKGGQTSVYVEPASTLNWGGGMIDADPLFVDPPGFDFHIPFNSPCREAGSNNAPNLQDEDFEGDPRIAYAYADQGADEFHTHLYWTGTASPGGAVQIKMTDTPGTTPVLLFASLGILEPPLPTMYGEWYLDPPLILNVDLFMIPSSSGVLVQPVVLPPGTPAPLDIAMQALLDSQLTNLSVLEIK